MTAMMWRVRKSFMLIFLGTVGVTVLIWSLPTFFKYTTCNNVQEGRTGLQCQFAPNLSIRKFAFVETNLKNSSRTKVEHYSVNLKDSKCPDILSGMVNGRWITRPLTQREQTTIDTYLQEERVVFRIPSTNQREDGRCGNVTYQSSLQYKHMMFKAICDSKGPTPCCRTNRCLALTEQECQCPTCYDERQAIHAEYAQWTPKDDRCGVKNYTKEEACKVLNGTTLHFVGDSFVRHVFAALVIILTNEIDGALKNGTPWNHRDTCKRMHQITGAICRNYLEQDRLLCNGTVKTTYTQVFHASDVHFMLPLLRTLHQANKSIIIFGLGIHDNFNLRTVAKGFLLPVLNLHRLLSTNVTSDMDLENVFTNFGIFNTSSRNGDLQDKGIARSSGNSEPLMSESQNEYPIKKYNIWGNLGFPVFNNDLDKQGLHFYRVMNRYNQMNQRKEEINLGLSNKKNILNDVVETGIVQNISKQLSHMLEPNTVLDVGVNHSMTQQPPPADNLPLTQTPQPQLTNADLNVNRSSTIFHNLPKPGKDVRSWPQFLWIGIHAPGLLKSPHFKEQSAEGVHAYNNGIYNILNEWKVPYLDTFGFTNGTVSYDGTHYGWGINMLKVNMLLTYFHQGFMEERECDDGP